MRRYAFRLAGVLRVRRNEQDVAQAAVLRARAAAAEQAALLGEREQAYASALGAGGSRSRGDFVHEQTHRAALAASVLEQRTSLQRAQDEISAAAAVLSAAAARVSALERLDERARAEHAAAALREDERVVDDLVVSRFSHLSTTGTAR